MTLYRFALIVLAPLVLGALIWRVLRGQETRADLAERLGWVQPLPQGGAAGPVIWLHAASNGELAAARPLIEALHQRAAETGTGLRFAVTTNSLSGRDLARQMGVARATLAPVDLRCALRRFLRATGPALALSVESELWPNRLALLAGASVPVAMAGARMSEGSARRWSRLGPARRLMARMLAVPGWLAPLDQATGTRLTGLGLRPAALAAPLDLKAAAARPAAAVDLPPDQTRARTVLAASTHEGDEALMIRAMAPLLASAPELRLILAPRHPRRAEEIEALLGRAGLAHARRSTGGGLADLSPRCPVLLADTLGEMPLWYAAAGLCVIGGSFSDRGGHTPYEPVAAGCAVIYGPDMANFRSAAAALAPGGGQIRADALPARLRDLLEGADNAVAALAERQARLIPSDAGRLAEAAREILTLRHGDI